MSTLLLFLVTLFLLLLIFGFLWMLRRPVYRLSEANVIRLLDMVLVGTATENDWSVFIDVPIRYNDDLEAIRLKSVQITESYSEGKVLGFLFSKEGLTQIQALRDELQAQS